MLKTLAKRTLHTSLNVRHNPLSEPLRREVSRAIHRLNRTDLSRRTTVDFAGYSVSFCGANDFRHLVDEVFAKASYYFEADAETPTIIDCGSNIGMSVLFFKKLYPSARITAFEPDPETFNVLTKNVSVNNLADVELHQVALGANNGTLDFYRAWDDEQSDLTMSVKSERRGGKTLKVRARRLSDFITQPIDLLKLDVEGAEPDVIQDLVAGGKLSMVKTMHIEYHHHVSRPDNLSDFLRPIEQSGFGYQIDAAHGTFAKRGSFQDVSLYCYRT